MSGFSRTVVRNNRSGVMPSPLRRLALVILLATVAFPLAAARQLGAQVPTPEAHPAVVQSLATFRLLFNAILTSR